MNTKTRMSIAVAALGLAMAMASGTALAQRGGGHGGYHGSYHGGGHWRSDAHFGFYFGGPLWYPGPWYYPYPYAYPAYPPTVVVPSGPSTYIERDDQPMASGQASPYWYYCRESNAYYPYVKECAGQWERVPAQPQ